MDINTSRQYQDEKSLQFAWFNYYKANSHWDFPCLEEGLTADYTKEEFRQLQDHQFLIVEDLKLAVKRLNKSLYETHKSSLSISESEFYEGIVEHVKSIYNFAKTQQEVPVNYLLYQYTFNKGMKVGSNHIIERKIQIKKTDNSLLTLEYKIIATDWNKLGSDNLFRLVREKKIHTTGLTTKDSAQYPDFAIYINGLPAYCIEFKSPSVSWKEAWKDYQNKPSYHFFWGCIGVDGVKAFISSTYQGSKEPRLWAKYGKRRKGLTYGAKDIADELICNRNNLVFFAISCIQTNQEHYERSQKTEYFIEALSVQQYYVVLEAEKRFQSLEMQNNSGQNQDILKEVVKHVQRSGKSKTIRGIITSMFTFHNGLFKKVYLQVPDTTIRKQFLTKTFGDNYILNMGKAIEVKSQEDYIKSINSSESGLFIMNMQKISEDANKKVNVGKDVLIILDEVHTHQLGENFQIRLNNFPNASYISFTATPRIVSGKTKSINMTNTVYADGKESYLDEFTSADAIENNIIIPIVYERAKYAVNMNFDGIVDLDKNLYFKIRDLLDNPPSKMWSDYADKINEILSDKCLMATPEEIEKLKTEAIREFIDRNQGALIQQIYREVKIENILEKADWIIDDFKFKRDKVYSNQLTGDLYFKTKAFWVADDIQMATEILCRIKKKYGSCVANGIRFAVDYSFESTTDTSTVQVHKVHFPELYEKIENGIKISTGYSLTSLDELNDEPIGGEPIIDKFNSTLDDCVDILIIVGKYIMGYDNPNLVAVYCDTEFDEISRIYQLATRPATKRMNKECGYFVDLGLTQRNQQTYKAAIQAYEIASANHTFVLDEDVLAELNNELGKCLHKMGDIIGANYPKDFLSLKTLDNCLTKLENDQVDKSQFFIQLTSINKILKKLAIPTNYEQHRQPISLLITAISNFFDLLKAKKKEEHIIKFTKDDIRSAVQDIFYSLGFKNGIKDILDFQIKHAEEFHLDQDSLEKAKSNKKFLGLKTKIENEDKFLNASIYEKLTELVKDCEKTTSVEEKNKIMEEIERIKEEHRNYKQKFSSQFKNQYHAVVYQMLIDWLSNLNMDKIWNEQLYKDFAYELSDLAKTYFDTHKTSEIKGYEIQEKINARYPTTWITLLVKNTENMKNPEIQNFRANVIDINNSNVQSFIESLLQTLILTFEEQKNVEYI
jgi:type I site-specific restriction-modification system R (restriction) subunit